MEKVNQIMEDLLRTCILDFRVFWEDHLQLVEFTYNSSYEASIRMAPFGALYGRPCRSPLSWWNNIDKIIFGPDMVEETSKMVDLIRRRMENARDRQNAYADRRCMKLEFAMGDMVL